MAILPCLISDCRAAGRRRQAQPTEPGLPAASAGGGLRRRGSGAARLAQEANRGLGRVTPELALRQVERVEVADHGVQLSAERRGHEAWTQAGPAEAGAAGPGLWLLQAVWWCCGCGLGGAALTFVAWSLRPATSIMDGAVARATVGAGATVGAYAEERATTEICAQRAPTQEKAAGL